MHEGASPLTSQDSIAFIASVQYSTKHARRDAPTNPACDGSCPDPPPQISATFERSGLAT